VSGPRGRPLGGKAPESVRLYWRMRKREEKAKKRREAENLNEADS